MRRPAVFRVSCFVFCVSLCLALLVFSARAAAPARAVPLGINLEACVDFSRSMMFADLIKTGRKFGTAQTPWDQKAEVDANGWPTGDAGLVVVADSPVPAGDYLFACTGRCDLSCPASKATVKNVAWDATSKTMTATITVDDNAETLFLSFKNTDGGIKNIRLLRPGLTLKSPDLFGKDFLKALAPFSTIRTMDATRTNNNQSKEWADRAKTTDALQSSEKGIAWEYVIALSNQTGKDIWINIPALASDDYVKQLATLFKTTLNKDRVVYVEYSNEVWNTMFAQYTQNLQAARSEVANGNTTLNDNGADPNDIYWGYRRVAKRLVEITNIFKSVYGASAINTTIRPVLASQSANVGIATVQLAFIEKNYGPPAKVIYGLAGAPYVGLEGAVSSREDLTVDDLFNTQLPAYFETVKKWILDYDQLAKKYQIHSLCYEGGPALEGAQSLQAKLAANRDDRMTKFLTDYLTFWYSNGGELFCYYSLASPYGRWGCWGLTEDIRKPSPKLKAINQILGGNNSPSPKK